MFTSRVVGDILCGREVDQATTNAMLSLFPNEEITRNIIVWRNANKDYINERHAPTAVGGGGAAAPVIPLSAKDKWDRFYADSIANVNNRWVRLIEIQNIKEILYIYYKNVICCIRII